MTIGLEGQEYEHHAVLRWSGDSSWAPLEVEQPEGDEPEEAEPMAEEIPLEQPVPHDL